MIFTIESARNDRNQPHPRAVRRDWVEHHVIENPGWIKDGELVRTPGYFWAAVGHEDEFMDANYPNWKIVGNNCEYDTYEVEFTIEVSDLADLLSIQVDIDRRLIIEGKTILVYDDYLE